MSRPSITTLVRSPISRCFATMARRTPGNHRDLRAPFGNLRRADRVGDILAVQLDAPGRELDLRGDGQLLHAVHVVRSRRLRQRPQRHRAIHGAGIDVGEAEPRGDALGDGALARAGGAVDRDDDPSWLGICQEIE